MTDSRKSRHDITTKNVTAFVGKALRAVAPSPEEKALNPSSRIIVRNPLINVLYFGFRSSLIDCSLVLTTSIGYVESHPTIPAKPPARRIPDDG